MNTWRRGKATGVEIFDPGSFFFVEGGGGGKADLVEGGRGERREWRCWAREEGEEEVSTIWRKRV
jgi:hypothetical protein